MDQIFGEKISLNESSFRELMKQYGTARLYELFGFLLDQRVSEVSLTLCNTKSKAFLKALFELYEEIFQVYQGLKQGHLDFDDLLRQCLALFKQYPEVLSEYQKKIKYILVDEFQDTDAYQSQIIDLLISGDGVRPMLMVVGDPKQSIYLFRGAQVELFQKLKQDVVQGEGFCFHMAQNFRSEKPLIEFTNRLFEPLLGDFFKASEVGQDQSKEATVSYWTLKEAEKFSLQARRQCEARWLAEEISKYVGLGKEKESIAILFRALTHAELYEEALSEKGIPVVKSSLGKIFEDSAIQSLMALFRWVLDQNDAVSFFQILMAPWGLLSQGTLLKLFQVRKKENLNGVAILNASHLKDCLTGEELSECRYLSEFLKRVKSKKDRMSLEQWFRLIPLPASYSKDYFFKIIRSFEQFYPDHQWKDFVSYVDCIGEIPFRMEEPVEKGDSGGVQLLTIHQAKGLEFDRVYLPDLSYVARSQYPMLLVDKAFGCGIKIFKNMRFVEDDEIYSVIRKHQKQKELEESKRLFYVAVTRAKKHLILSHSAPTPKTNTWANWVEAQRLTMEKHEFRGEV